MPARTLVLAALSCLLPVAVIAESAQSNGAPAAADVTPQTQPPPSHATPDASEWTVNPAMRSAPDSQHNPTATAWIVSAETKLREKDTAGAAERLLQAKQLNDHERGLWLVTGDIELSRGQTNQAIEDYKREAARYPDNPFVYPRLAHAYFTQGDTNSGEQTERDWAKLLPLDAAPRAALAYALLMTERYSESAAAYGQAIALAPKPDMLKVQLGRAQIRSSQVEAGEATLRALLAQSKDAAVLNGAAYELGDAGLDLPEAEMAAHKAVGMVADRSAAAQLETATDEDLAQMPLLAEGWDTLGWILFKQHRLTEAESYARSAWLLGDHDEVGLHLGEIYEAEGKKTDALVTDRMAAGLISSQHPWPYYAHMKETLLARAAALQQGASTATTGADTFAATELRSYTVASPVSGSAATAEFLLHMTEGRVDGVRFLRGDASLKAAAGELKSAKYNVAVPAISRARLLRRATLTCLPGAATCTLRLTGVHSARMGE